MRKYFKRELGEFRTLRAELVEVEPVRRLNL